MSHIQPARTKETTLPLLASKHATVVGMDTIPRQLSRAQTFDSLSSQVRIGLRTVWTVWGCGERPVLRASDQAFTFNVSFQCSGCPLCLARATLLAGQHRRLQGGH